MFSGLRPHADGQTQSVKIVWYRAELMVPSRFNILYLSLLSGLRKAATTTTIIPQHKPSKCPINSTISIEKNNMTIQKTLVTTSASSHNFTQILLSHNHSSSVPVLSSHLGPDATLPQSTTTTNMFNCWYEVVFLK
ncbi:hypothetical protein ATANTOWER_023990 [Ataeniobius toweri]|uniref:Uncharacterized protein n=1 Tax=Ataeniobius toweri TaxID=208326 RepID=A0ABU7ART5_9TELE|nr:hypothetical protein [Ataeniobius toweri]